MKQRIYAFTVLAAACVLFTAGCEEEKDPEHTNPSYLVGTWANEGIASFTIKADYTFVCDLVELPSAGPGRVYGKLNYTSKKLGPNDFLMQGMTAGNDGDPDVSYNAGNDMLKGALPGFDNLLATFTPSSDKRKFTFKTQNQAAQIFFGGVYTKE